VHESAKLKVIPSLTSMGYPKEGGGLAKAPHGVMNFKRKKPNYNKQHRPYDVIWSYKKSFKRDYREAKKFDIEVRKNLSTFDFEY